MKYFLFELYALLFSNPFFYKWNKLLFHLSLRGLGVLNYRKEILIGEKKWLRKELKGLKEGTIIDIGANIGNYTKMVHQTVSSDTKIYCFEPHPVTYKHLELNLNKTNSKLFNMAVGNHNGSINIYDYKNKDGSTHASLYKDVIEKIHNQEAISHQIKIITLDDFISENQIEQIDLLKIDTEGNELEVLLGAQKALEDSKIKRIQFEFNEMNIISKSTFKEFYDLLSLRFRLYRIMPLGKLLEIEKYKPILQELYGYQNIVAILK